jgi:ATP-dependent RNA helicase RhlE
LVKRLGKQKLHALAMHGNKSQNQRERALARFAKGDVDTLVATDVAARGIDVDDITHVINFDAPGDRDAYVHRVGRTARAGRDGSGISFVLPEQAGEMRRIAASLGLSREFDHNRNPSDGGHARSNGSRTNKNKNRHSSNNRHNTNGRRRHR